MADHAADAGHDEHAHSVSHYVKIWAILLVLLIISIAGPEVAENFPATTGKIIVLVTAFGIAFYKAYLVVKHFMHLTIEKPIVGYILITCLIFMVLFFAGVAPDIMSHEGTNWKNLAAVAEIERALAEAEAEESPEAKEEEAAAEKPPSEPAEAAQINFSDLGTDAERKAWLMHRGEEIYLNGIAGKTAPCASCHRADGTGHPPAGPPLVGQKEHIGDCKTTGSIVRDGLDDDLEIDGVTYDRAMPPAKNMTPAEVASVASYIRNGWGNDYGICAPGDI